MGCSANINTYIEHMKKLGNQYLSLRFNFCICVLGSITSSLGDLHETINKLFYCSLFYSFHMTSASIISSDFTSLSLSPSVKSTGFLFVSFLLFCLFVCLFSVTGENMIYLSVWAWLILRDIVF